MYNKYISIVAVVLLAIFSLATSCEKPTPDPDEPTTGKLKINMSFNWGNNPLEFDTLMYVNAAGNKYLVYEAQFFITNVTIYKGGVAKVLNSWQKAHYFDTNYPNTLEWPIVDDIEKGNYDSLSFTFGFTNDDNESFMYVNPPENQMFWPEYLGGGYHYMKLNGKWENPDGYLRGSAFHMGKGQIYDANGDITGFIDNSFRVSIPNSGLSISATNTTNFDLVMDVEQWFVNPTIYNHNDWGGDIMENQNAMAIARQNGWNVFRMK
jgi:hypothetical protein